MKKKLIFTFLLIFILFFLSELLLKSLNVNYPVFQKHDEITGFSLLPNTQGIWNREGYGNVKINSMGLRDNEHKLLKDKDTYRIAILGDSFTEARYLNIEETFWYKLQPNLNGCNLKNFEKIEVINFGVTEYSTTQEFLTLKYKVWEYNPDLILLSFYSGNDVKDNSKVLASKKHRPFFILEGDKLELDQSFKNTKPYILLESTFGKIFLEISKHSRVSQLFREIYVRGYFRYLKNNNKIIDNDNKIYNEYSSTQKDWKEAWDITEKILMMMNEEIKNKNKFFYIVTLSTPIQVHPDPKKRDEFKKKYNITNIDYADERILSFGKKNNIKVLNLAESMRKIAEQNNIFFHGFENTELGTGHWNIKANEYASREISNDLCKSIFTK